MADSAAARALLDDELAGWGEAVLLGGGVDHQRNPVGNDLARPAVEGCSGNYRVGRTDKPMAGASVAVPGYRSTTGSNGTCRFSLGPGRYSVLVNKAGYRGRRLTAGVRPGETTTTEVRLQKLSPAPPPKK